jgi:hypothetical protein
VTLPTEQTLSVNANTIRKIIPAGAQVSTECGWWILGSDRAVYSLNFSDIQYFDSRIEYIVKDGNGTGRPGTWSPTLNPRYDSMIRDNFEIISNTLQKSPEDFGRPNHKQRVRIRDCGISTYATKDIDSPISLNRGKGLGYSALEREFLL